MTKFCVVWRTWTTTLTFLICISNLSLGARFCFMIVLTVINKVNDLRVLRDLEVKYKITFKSTLSSTWPSWLLKLPIISVFLHLLWKNVVWCLTHPQDYVSEFYHSRDSKFHLKVWSLYYICHELTWVTRKLHTTSQLALQFDSSTALHIVTSRQTWTSRYFLLLSFFDPKDILLL